MLRCPVCIVTGAQPSSDVAQAELIQILPASQRVAWVRNLLPWHAALCTASPFLPLPLS